jgi:hypothetical protein
MIDFGIVKPGTTLYVPFHTFDSNDPSASVTITGLAGTDIEIYKNGSTTQRASDTGYSLLDTDGIDFDGITGIHGFSIDLSSNATAGFFTAGAQYWVVVSSVTVDAATVNFVAATFRIGYPDAILNTTIATLSSQTSFTLTAGSADNSAYVGCPVIVHDIASAIQVAVGYVSAYTGSTKTVTLAADPGIFTMAAGDNISLFMPSNMRAVAGSVTSATNIGTAGTNYSATRGLSGTALPAAAADAAGGLPISDAGGIDLDALNTNVSAILTDTGEIGVAGAGLTEAGGTGDQFTGIASVGAVAGAVGSVTGNVGGNVTGSIGSLATQAKADVNAECDTALSDYDAVVPADLPTNFADLSISATTGRVDVASIAGTAQTAKDLGAINVTNLNTLSGHDPGSQIAAQSDVTGLNDPTAAAIADAVWDEALAGHVGAGSSGERMGRIPNASAAGNGGLPTVDASNQIAGIQGTKNTLDDLNDVSTADVNGEVVDALATDTYAEPGQGAPGATISLSAKINYLYKAWRNKTTQTATTYTLFADDASTADQKSTVSDDGSTFTKGEMATGA